jgi:hypothetical protein
MLCNPQADICSHRYTLGSFCDSGVSRSDDLARGGRVAYPCAVRKGGSSFSAILGAPMFAQPHRVNVAL